MSLNSRSSGLSPGLACGRWPLAFHFFHGESFCHGSSAWSVSVPLSGRCGSAAGRALRASRLRPGAPGCWFVPAAGCPGAANGPGLGLCFGGCGLACAGAASGVRLCTAGSGPGGLQCFFLRRRIFVRTFLKRSFCRRKRGSGTWNERETGLRRMSLEEQAKSSSRRHSDVFPPRSGRGKMPAAVCLCYTRTEVSARVDEAVASISVGKAWALGWLRGWSR